MKNLSYILLLTTILLGIVNSIEITLTSQSIVHMEKDLPGVITIDGAKYRDSATTKGKTQFTTTLNPGQYVINADRYEVYPGTPIKRLNKGNFLKSIQINTAKGINSAEFEQWTFTLEKKSMVGIAYHLELTEKQSCQTSNIPHNLLTTINVNSIAKRSTSGTVVNDIVEVELNPGIHTISMSSINTGGGLWGNYPSLGNGFQSGRYLYIWKIKEDTTINVPQTIKPEPVREDITIISLEEAIPLSIIPTVDKVTIPINVTNENAIVPVSYYGYYSIANNMTRNNNKSNKTDNNYDFQYDTVTPSPFDILKFYSNSILSLF